jgi:hypothetical protein
MSIIETVTTAVQGLSGFPPFLGLMALAALDTAVLVWAAWHAHELDNTEITDGMQKFALVVGVFILGQSLVTTSPMLAFFVDPLYAAAAVNEVLSILKNVRLGLEAQGKPVPIFVGVLTGRLSQFQEGLLPADFAAAAATPGPTAPPAIAADPVTQEGHDQGE